MHMPLFDLHYNFLPPSLLQYVVSVFIMHGPYLKRNSTTVCNLIHLWATCPHLSWSAIASIRILYSYVVCGLLQGLTTQAKCDGEVTMLEHDFVNLNPNGTRSTSMEGRVQEIQLQKFIMCIIIMKPDGLTAPYLTGMSHHFYTPLLTSWAYRGCHPILWGFSERKETDL